jgi:6-pyruvoyltetrahydropterin/6-carboxytetrahydropterin synthase
MARIRITKEFKFEMAHALHGYDGLCKHMHGHSYKLFVTVIGEPNQDATDPKLGMVMDFGDLKKIVKKEIVDHFDHAIVINKATADELDCPQHTIFGRMIVVDYQPSSENMLIDFAARIKPHLPANISLHSMLLRETVTSYAEWYAEDN